MRGPAAALAAAVIGLAAAGCAPSSQGVQPSRSPERQFAPRDPDAEAEAMWDQIERQSRRRCARRLAKCHKPLTPDQIRELLQPGPEPPPAEDYLDPYPDEEEDDGPVGW